MWTLSTVDYSLVLLSAILSFAKRVIPPFFSSLPREYTSSSNPHLSKSSTVLCLPPPTHFIYCSLSPTINTPAPSPPHLLLCFPPSVLMSFYVCPSLSTGLLAGMGCVPSSMCKPEWKTALCTTPFFPLISTFILFCILCLFISFCLSITLSYSPVVKCRAKLFTAFSPGEQQA